MKKLVHVAVLALSAWLVVSFVWVVIQRFRFPVEVEWMGGSILDHVERVKRGEPIYVAPSSHFVPYLYPPLYYWVSAMLARITSVFVACRVVSLVSTVVSAVMIHAIARSLGASRTWSLVAVGFFFGGYSLTGFWYDIERCDSLATMIMLAGALAWARLGERTGPVVAGALFALAFLGKQTALSLVLWPAIALAVTRQWKPLARFAVGAAVGAIPTIALGASNPWFFRYCVTMPSKHGIDVDLVTGLVVDDLGKGFLFTGATLVVCGAWITSMWKARRGGASTGEMRDVVPGAILFGAFVSATSARLHVGGYLNVLIPWVAFASIAAAVVLSRVEEVLSEKGLARAGAIGASLLAATQLMHLAFDPKAPSPDAQRVVDAAIVEDVVRKLETRGDVVLSGRGHVTAHPHFHCMALMDTLRGGLPLPADFVSDVEHRRYAAYVVDEFGELTLEAIIGHRSELFGLMERNYFVGRRLDDRERPPVIGWTAHPTWVMLPRKNPLTLSDDALDRRMHVEMGLAEARMRQKQAGVAPHADDEAIEDEAAALDTPR